MKFMCTMNIHIALGCALCNMNFQSANEFHIALTKVPYLYNITILNHKKINCMNDRFNSSHAIIQCCILMLSTTNACN